MQHTRNVWDNIDQLDLLLACSHRKAARTFAPHKQLHPSCNNSVRTCSSTEHELRLHKHAMNLNLLGRINLAGVVLGAFVRHDRNRDS